MRSIAQNLSVNQSNLLIVQQNLSPQEFFNYVIEWLEENNSAQDLLFVLDRFDEREYRVRNGVIKNWCNNSNSQKIREILDLIPDNPSYKNNIVLNFLTKFESARFYLRPTINVREERTAEDIKNFIDEISENHVKDRIIFDFLIDTSYYRQNFHQIDIFYNAREILSYADFKELLSKVVDSQIRDEITEIFFKKPENQNLDNFVDLAKSNLIGNGVYDVDEIIKIFLRAAFDISDFVELFEKIYLNDYYLQTESLIRSVDFIRHNQKFFSHRAKQNFLEFSSKIPEDDYFLNFITNLRSVSHLGGDEIIAISSDILSRRFPLVDEILRNYNLSDSLVESGVENILEIFPDIQINQPTLSNLFSYYRLLPEGLAIFKSLVREDILAELRDNFKPSHQILLISSQEIEYLGIIFSLENIEIPSVNEISQVLNNLPIENFSIESIDNFVFGSSDLLSARENINDIKNSKESENKIEKLGYDEFGNLNQDIEFNRDFADIAEIEISYRKESQGDKESEISEFRMKKSQEFRKFLATEVSSEEIAEFFKDIFQLESSIKESEQKVLKDFFERDKFLLASLFLQENGLDAFRNSIYSLAEGCFANIGTHARIILVNELVKEDVNKKILFSVYNQYINNQILTNPNIGVDHPQSGSRASTIFNDQRVNSFFFSPIALVEKIKQEFYYEDKRINDPYRIIINEYVGLNKCSFDEDSRVEYLVNYQNINQKAHNKKASELATYLLIKKEIPSLLDNKYLAAFKQECEQMIDYIERNVCQEIKNTVLQELKNKVEKGEILRPSSNNIFRDEAAQPQKLTEKALKPQRQG